MSAYVLLIAILATFATAVILITGWLETTADEIARKAIDGLAEGAADFDEPTRAQVEADMRDDAGWERLWVAVEATEPTPIYTATVNHIAKHAAASIEDEWVELNGGAS